MTAVKHQPVIDAMTQLAERICTCPDCADKAVQLLKLVGELSDCYVDRTSVHDAIEAETLDEMSESRIERTTDSVLGALRRSH